MATKAKTDTAKKTAEKKAAAKKTTTEQKTVKADTPVRQSPYRYRTMDEPEEHTRPVTEKPQPERKKKLSESMWFWGIIFGVLDVLLLIMFFILADISREKAKTEDWYIDHMSPLPFLQVS